MKAAHILIALLSCAACANPKVTELTCSEGQTIIWTSGQWQCKTLTSQGSPGPTGATGPAGSATLPTCSVADLLLATASGWVCQTSQCPVGYALSTASGDTDYTVCIKAVSGSANPDEMVKVGGFWIDRYEMSTCSGEIETPNGYATTAVACSVTNAQPAVNVTWFQAAQMCANAGKELCSNAEWQTAASGTVDPGAYPNTTNCNTGSTPTTAGQCNTCSGGARKTGLGAASAGGECYSTYGAEDMIGNVFEWTADWGESGPVSTSFSTGAIATPWPGGYGDGLDTTLNLNGTSNTAGGVSTVGLPGAFNRGGYFGSGGGAGAFSLSLVAAPSNPGLGTGARCCIRGR